MRCATDGSRPCRKGHRRFHGRQVALELPLEGLHPRRALFGGHGLDALAQGAQAVGREQAQHQGKGEIFLHRRVAARTQETGQVGGRRIRGIQLRHRRDDGEKL
jgi:hypothetical protein